MNIINRTDNKKKVIIKSVSEPDQQYKKELENDLKIINKDYEEKISNLVKFINKNNFSKLEKLRIIYNYLVDNCDIEWDYFKYLDENLNYTALISYNYKGLKYAKSFVDNNEILRGGLVNIGNKYGPVLIGKGVCSGFSEAFEDIAKRVNLNVHTVTGKHSGVGHTWIAIYSDGNNYKFIDVYQGIVDKKNGINNRAFMMSESDLPKMGYRNYHDSLSKVKAKRFVVKKLESPKFRIVDENSHKKHM